MKMKFGNMEAEFEIFLDKSGQYRCRLKTADGESVNFGKGYRSEAVCMATILKAMSEIKKEADQSVRMLGCPVIGTIEFAIAMAFTSFLDTGMLCEAVAIV